MSEKRPEYPLKIIINNRRLSRVIIDQHYKEKHNNIDDLLILKLVETLNGENFEIEDERAGFQYFVVDPVELENKAYRLILLLCISDDFLGVVNAFRVRIKK